MDEGENYKKSMKRIVLRRKAALYRELGLPMVHDANSVRYYHLLDLASIATQMHGAEFAVWLRDHMKPNEMLFRLAEETGVVLLPGKGFGTPYPSARVPRQSQRVGLRKHRTVNPTIGNGVPRRICGPNPHAAADVAIARSCCVPGIAPMQQR